MPEIVVTELMKQISKNIKTFYQQQNCSRKKTKKRRFERYIEGTVKC